MSPAASLTHWPVAEFLVPAGSGISKGGGSIDGLESGLFDRQVRVDVACGVGKIEFDPAKGVDDRGEPSEFDLEIVAGPNPGREGHRLHHQLSAAERRRPS